MFFVENTVDRIQLLIMEWLLSLVRALLIMLLYIVKKLTVLVVIDLLSISVGSKSSAISLLFLLAMFYSTALVARFMARVLAAAASSLSLLALSDCLTSSNSLLDALVVQGLS